MKKVLFVRVPPRVWLNGNSHVPLSKEWWEQIVKKALFPLGMLLETPGARDSFAIEEKADAVRRHAAGDWGEVSAEDRAANDAAMQAEERIVSEYVFGERKLWVITEADRSYTTLLLPEEY